MIQSLVHPTKTPNLDLMDMATHWSKGKMLAIENGLERFRYQIRTPKLKLTSVESAPLFAIRVGRECYEFDIEDVSIVKVNGGFTAEIVFVRSVA